MRNADRVSVAERVGTGRHLDADVARHAAIPVVTAHRARRMTDAENARPRMVASR